jgi:hypothetical protein
MSQSAIHYRWFMRAPSQRTTISGKSNKTQRWVRFAWFAEQWAQYPSEMIQATLNRCTADSNQPNLLTRRKRRRNVTRALIIYHTEKKTPSTLTQPHRPHKKRNSSRVSKRFRDMGD